jgi:hypothetical protein
MLIQKTTPLKNGDYVSLKLINGDEIVGKVKNIKEMVDGVAHLTLTKPVSLQVQMVSPQQAGIGFVPFMLSPEEDDVFAVPYTSLLVAPMKAGERVAAAYVKTTSGLEIPTGKSGLMV